MKIGGYGRFSVVGWKHLGALAGGRQRGDAVRDANRFDRGVHREIAKLRNAVGTAHDFTALYWSSQELGLKKPRGVAVALHSCLTAIEEVSNGYDFSRASGDGPGSP